MMRFSLRAVLSALVFFGCFAEAAVPVITSIIPESTTVGVPSFTLTVNGSNFEPGSVVRWNGSDRTTVFSSTRALRATITAADVAEVGEASITVFNPGASGGLSGALRFFITENPMPVLEDRLVGWLNVGSENATIDVNGQGFTPTSVVRWNGSPRPTSFFSTTLLRATPLPADLAETGTAAITVYNPPPGGGTSPPQNFNILPNPLPSVGAVHPFAVAAGGGELRLRISGSSFTRLTRVRWNGLERPVRFLSNTELEATIPASDTAVPGLASVSAVNPEFGSGSSPSFPVSVFVGLITNDLVWDRVSGRLWASTPSRAAGLGNSIVSIDPVSGAISAPIFVGAEPNRLALSGDGQYLYAVLDGAFAIRRVNLRTRTAELQFALTVEGGLPAQVIDMAVMPGNPRALAVSRRGPLSPASLGVAVYDDGVKRPQEAGGALTASEPGISPFEFGASGSIIYGTNGGGDLRVLNVDSTGAREGTGARGVLDSAYDLRFENGRIYGNTGAVVDAATLTRAGSYAVQGFDTLVWPDSQGGRTYFATNDSREGFRILAFEQATFRSVGFQPLPGVSVTGDSFPYFSGFVRWGDDGLALRTSAGQVFTFRSPLVRPSVLNTGGAVNAASFAADNAVAPGSIISIFGTNLAPQSGSALSAPLPLSLLRTELRMDDISVPLFFVSATQINAQVPWEMANRAQATMKLLLDGVESAPIRLNVSPYSPGIFTMTQTGRGQGAILDAQGRLVNASAPARAGDTILIFCTGLGAVREPPTSGGAASLSRLSPTTATPTVTIGGLPATVAFSGLAPGFVGLYQLNVTVPAGVASNEAVPVVVRIGGLNSNTATIAAR